MANILPIRPLPPYALTQQEISKVDQIYKIAFKGFEDKDHWVQAIKKVPNILIRHNYTEITFNLDERNQPLWVLNEDLIHKFMSTSLELSAVLQYFPLLSAPKLLSIARTCTNGQISQEQIETMIKLGLEYKKEPVLKCYKKAAARTLIAGRGQSYILFTKRSQEKDLTIGVGTTKRVKFALGISTARIYAVGISLQEHLRELDWKLINNEVDLLYELKGIDGILQIAAALQWEKKYYVITEYYNEKDLDKVFEKHPPLAFHNKVQIAIGVTQGLLNLHYLEILHRDLKPANIFINAIKDEFGGERFEAVIGDLGSACKTNQKEFAGYRTGTIAYLAPEKLTSLNDLGRTEEWIGLSTPEADIWSLGLILFSLFHPKMGSLMDFQKKDKEIRTRIQNLTDREIEHEIKASGIEPKIQEILLQMLQLQPNKRRKALWAYEKFKEQIGPLEKRAQID